MNDLSDVQTFLRNEKENRIVSSRGGPLITTLGSIQSFHVADAHRYMKDNATEFMLGLYLVDCQTPLQEEEESDDHYSKRLETYFGTVVDSYPGNGSENHARFYTYATASFLNVHVYIVSRNEFGKYCWEFYPGIRPNGNVQTGLSYITMALIDGYYYKVTSNDRAQGPPKAEGIVGMCRDALKDRLEKLKFEDITVPEVLVNKCKAGNMREHTEETCRLISTKTVKECRFRLKKQGFRLPGTDHRLETEQVVKLCLDNSSCFVVFFKVLLMKGNIQIIKLLSGHNFTVAVVSSSFLENLGLLDNIEKNLIRRKIPTDDLTNSCKMKTEDLTERRGVVNKVIIGTSSSGIVGGILCIVGLALVPVTFGASVGLTIAGTAVGGVSGVAGGFARVREALKQNKAVKDIKQVQEQIVDMDTELNALLLNLQRLFSSSVSVDRLQCTEMPGISLRGFLAIGSVFRSSHTALPVFLAVARVSGTAAAVAASVLGPLSLGLDIAFLTEAAYNAKKKKNKTNAGEMLEKMGSFFKIKDVIMHSMLRGNTEQHISLLNRV